MRSSRHKDEIIYPGVRPEHNKTKGLTSGSSPLFIGSKSRVQRLLSEYSPISYELPEGAFNLHVTDITVEWVGQSSSGNGSVHVLETEASRNLPGFDQFMPASARQTGFILDIDLDAFVSNGSELAQGRSVMPVSYGREQSNHDMTSEGDLASGLSAGEMYMIRKRVDEFFRRLEDAKRNGVLPKVITIADSTQLMRAIRG